MNSDAPPDRTILIHVDPVPDDALQPSSALSRRLRAALAQGYALILLDVGHLAYCDSVTLGAIVHAYTTAIHAGARVKLVHPTRRFRELLARTKLDRVLETVDTDAGDGRDDAERAR